VQPWTNNEPVTRMLPPLRGIVPGVRLVKTGDAEETCKVSDRKERIWKAIRADIPGLLVTIQVLTMM